MGGLGPQDARRRSRRPTRARAAGLPLHGATPSEDGTLNRKSITCSRTFGQPLAAYEAMQGAVSAFLSRAAEKLRAQGDQAYVLTVFVQKNRFDPRVPPPYSRSATLTLPSGPSSDTLVLAQYAQHLLRRLWEPGTVYHKAGIVLNGLEPPSSGQQLGLFEAPVARVEPVAVARNERPQLMATLDGLNARFGKGTVRLGSARG
jgi:DNA polymerase V